jgi:hypothetical protein
VSTKIKWSQNLYFIIYFIWLGRYNCKSKWMCLPLFSWRRISY